MLQRVSCAIRVPLCHQEICGGICFVSFCSLLNQHFNQLLPCLLFYGTFGCRLSDGFRYFCSSFTDNSEILNMSFQSTTTNKGAQPSTHVLWFSCLRKTSGFWLVAMPRCFWWSAGACCPAGGHCRCPAPLCHPLLVQLLHSCRRWRSGGRRNPTAGRAPGTAAPRCGTAGTSRFYGCHSA